MGIGLEWMLARLAEAACEWRNASSAARTASASPFRLRAASASSTKACSYSCGSGAIWGAVAFSVVAYRPSGRRAYRANQSKPRVATASHDPAARRPTRGRRRRPGAPAPASAAADRTACPPGSALRGSRRSRDRHLPWPRGQRRGSATQLSSPAAASARLANGLRPSPRARPGHDRDRRTSTASVSTTTARRVAPTTATRIPGAARTNTWLEPGVLTAPRTALPAPSGLAAARTRVPGPKVGPGEIRRQHGSAIRALHHSPIEGDPRRTGERGAQLHGARLGGRLGHRRLRRGRDLGRPALQFLQQRPRPRHKRSAVPKRTCVREGLRRLGVGLLLEGRDRLDRARALARPDVAEGLGRRGRPEAQRDDRPAGRRRQRRGDRGAERGSVGNVVVGRQDGEDGLRLAFRHPRGGRGDGGGGVARGGLQQHHGRDAPPRPTARRSAPACAAPPSTTSGPSPCARSAASWKPDRSPTRRRNGFGRQGRDAGHRRSPEPPQRITG